MSAKRGRQQHSDGNGRRCESRHRWQSQGLMGRERSRSKAAIDPSLVASMKTMMMIVRRNRRPIFCFGPWLSLPSPCTHIRKFAAATVHEFELHCSSLPFAENDGDGSIDQANPRAPAPAHARSRWISRSCVACTCLALAVSWTEMAQRLRCDALHCNTFHCTES